VEKPRLSFTGAFEIKPRAKQAGQQANEKSKKLKRWQEKLAKAPREASGLSEA